MSRNLLIIGAGQYGQVAREVAEAIGIFNKVSFLDDNSELSIGKTEDMADFAEDYSDAIVAMGNPELKRKFYAMLKEAGFKVATLVHPRAYVSPSAVISEGCIIEPMAVVHTEAKVGACTFVSAGAVVNHNAVIGEASHIDIGSCVKARAVVETGVKVEAGEVFEG